MKGIDIQMMTKAPGVAERTQIEESTELLETLILNYSVQEETLVLETEVRVQRNKNRTRRVLSYGS